MSRAKSSPGGTPEPEPRVAAQLAPFEPGDLRVLADACARDPQYDGHRLAVRRKLLGLAKVAAARAREGGGVELEPRTSLHHPHAFNGMKVSRLWAYLCRGKKAKARLKKVLGSELARDLDSAYRNAYLCVALEHEALEVSLRVHADAWFDAQNLAKRVAAEGAQGWLAHLNELDGYWLRMADWKGEWRCGALEPEQLEEFLRFWRPGEMALRVEQRIPVPARNAELAAAVLDGDLPERLVAELLRLVPLYRFAAWSEESDHLFSP